MTSLILILLTLTGTGYASFLFVLKNLYFICQPSEILIFAGSRRGTDRGRQRGYRLVKGGSGIQLPLLEQTFRMDLTNMIIDLKVANAYSKGGIPLMVEGVANIKIAGSEPSIYNAIERLLGKKRQEIEALAKETLEGNLRGVLASLTPEEANSDQIAFAKSLLVEAEEDLEKLGLILDSLQIQRISDDVSYLDSIGRKQQAELIRDARIAEAKAKAESMIQASVNDRQTALRRITRDEEIAKADAEKRVRDAKTKRVAMVTEVESIVGAEIAKAQAELGVHRERIKQVEQQLQAEVIVPAEADCEQAIALAKIRAARIIETGRAQALGTQRLAQSWQAAGPAAREVFLLQKLEPLLKLLAASIPDVEVDQVRVIDAQTGTSATKVAGFLDQLRESSGIDVSELLSSMTTGAIASHSAPINQFNGSAANQG